MSRLLHSQHRWIATTLAAFFTLMLAPAPASAQASITFQPPGTFVYGVSEDGSTTIGFDGTYAYVEKNGNRTTLTMGGAFSFPSGVTANGSTVVGTEYDNNFVPRPWIWHEGNAAPTELLPGVAGFCFGMNPSGSLITGYRLIPDSFDIEAWAVRNGVYYPLTFPGAVSTFASGFSRDGSLITGEVYRFNQNGLLVDAVVWHADNSATLIPMPANTTMSRGIYISADGSTVVGTRETRTPSFEPVNFAWIWKVGDASVAGVDLGGGDTSVSWLTSDGSKVVGTGEIAFEVRRGWVWENGVTTILPQLSGYTNSSADGISADGYRIVGTVYGSTPPPNFPQEAVVWDGDKPPELLRDKLASYGVNVGPAQLYYAGVSADGTIIAGGFFNPSNPPETQYGTYIAFLPLPPEKQLADLIADVQGLGLEHGITNALLTKLNAAATALMNGDHAGAIAKLNDFINQVNGQSGKKIPTAVANELIAVAQAILVLL